MREPAVTYRLGSQTRLTAAVLKVTRKPSRKVLASARVKADRKAADALSLPVGHPLRRVEVLRLVDNRPVGISTYFFPLSRFEGIHNLIDQTGSISEAFQRLGVCQFARKSLQVKATLPTLQDVSHSRLVSAWLDLSVEFKD